MLIARIGLWLIWKDADLKQVQGGGKYPFLCLSRMRWKLLVRFLEGENLVISLSYLNRPYAALLLLVTEYDVLGFSV